MNKKILGLVLITLLVFETGCGCGKKEKKKDEPKSVTATDVIKDQKVDGIEMTKTSLVVEKGVSRLTTKVTNNTGSDYKLNEYVIKITDAKGTLIATIPGYVGDTIKNGETRIIDSKIDQDLSSATKIEYEVKK